MKERIDADSPVFKDFSSVEAAGPFDLITIFETVEHLDERELRDFFAQADKLLTKKGRILFSAPIEIGPAVLMKELNRCILHKRPPENSMIELFLSSFLGVAAKRAENIKGSHKGFDFRQTIRFLEDHY